MNSQADIRPEPGPYKRSNERRSVPSDRVCDCAAPSGCYTKGYAQRKDKAYFEMNNFDWTQHAIGCACEACTAFGKVIVRMLENMATSQDQETRLVGFHLTAWLNGSLNDEKLT